MHVPFRLYCPSVQGLGCKEGSVQVNPKGQTEHEVALPSEKLPVGHGCMGKTKSIHTHTNNQTITTKLKNSHKNCKKSHIDKNVANILLPTPKHPYQW